MFLCSSIHSFVLVLSYLLGIANELIPILYSRDEFTFYHQIIFKISYNHIPLFYLCACAIEMKWVNSSQIIGPDSGNPEKASKRVYVEVRDGGGLTCCRMTTNIFSSFGHLPS